MKPHLHRILERRGKESNGISDNLMGKILEIGIAFCVLVSWFFIFTEKYGLAKGFLIGLGVMVGLFISSALLTLLILK